MKQPQMKPRTQNEVDPEETFYVEYIKDMKESKKQGRRFLVKWQGFPETDNTWELEENLNPQTAISQQRKFISQNRNSCQSIQQLRIYYTGVLLPEYRSLITSLSTNDYVVCGTLQV